MASGVQQAATSPPAAQVNGWGLLRFIAPALPVGALGIPMALYLPPYFSGHVGLSLAAVGFAFFVVRTGDIFVDPLVGLFLDRTRTPWGQCRPWLAGGGMFISAGCLMLFLAQPGATVANLVAGLAILYLGTSMAGVAHPAWAARLSSNYNQRSSIYAWMYVASTVGTFFVLGAPTALGALGRLRPGGDVNAMGWGIAVAMPICLFIALVSTAEPPPAAKHAGRDDRVHFSDYLVLLRRPAIARLVLADVLTSVGVGLSTSLFLFFWRARGVSHTNTSVLVLVYLVASVAAVPIWMVVAKRIGKHRALMLSCFGFIAVIPGMAFLPADHLEILAPAIAVLGLTFAGQFLIRAMAADAADDARLQSGLDRTGQVYALLSSTAKAASAIAVGGGYGILDWAGFKPAETAVNTASAIGVLQALYIGFPAVAMLLGALTFVGYRLDGREHARILRELALRDVAAHSP